MKCISKVKCSFNLSYLAEKSLRAFGTSNETLWEERYDNAWDRFCHTYKECFDALDNGRCTALIMHNNQYDVTMISRSVKHEVGYQVTSFSTYKGRLTPIRHIHTTIDSIRFNELPETDIFMVTF